MLMPEFKFDLPESAAVSFYGENDVEKQYSVRQPDDMYICNLGRE